MKEATNSAGRKVSLLNDNEAPQFARHPSFTPSLRSRTSSYATSTSSIGSPPTPQLIRSHSSDSMDMQTPSPITPDFAVNDHEQEHFTHPGFFAPQHLQQQPKDMDASYPMMPYHQAQAAHPTYYAQQPPPQQLAAPPPPVAATANGRPKKNQYPCPLAKQENCHDFFTTSGHAARHSKKHTGRKDAICPECNKAFTRKDNMEQHRRTHKGGRSSAKTATDRGVKKAKARETQRPKISPVQSSTSPVLSSASMVDPSLPASPAGSFMSQPAQPPAAFMHQPAHVAPFIDFEQRNYPDPTAYAMTYAYTNGPPPSNDHVGLDVLATAASDPRRFTP